MKAVLGLTLVLLGFAVGCQKSSAPAPAASQVTSGEPPPAAAPEPPAPPPADYDVAGLEKELKCSGKGGREACKVLADFASGERWNAQMPSGEGRWIGNAYLIEKGAEQHQIVVLWAKRVPTSQVGRGDLPIRVGTGFLPEELNEHGNKLVNALSRGDTVSKRNRALPFVESFVAQNERGVGPTAGASVRLISEETVYLRQKGRKLLMVRLSREPSAAIADGTYAELWPAAW